MATDADKVRQIAASLEKQIREGNKAADMEFIDELHREIATPLKKIPENVFRELFLPYFIGEQTPDADHNPIAHWIGLVGSASEEAEVVNVKGEVLFKVPPMYDTSRINSTDRAKGVDGFSAIFENYIDDMKVRPVAGTNYLVEQLTRKVVQVTAVDEPQTASWDGVLDFYHLRAPGDMPKNLEAAVKKTISDDDLDFS